MKSKTIVFCLIILLCLLLITGFSNKTMYRSVITTDLADDAPVSDISTLSINAPKILLYTYWFNLKVGKKYEYKVAIYDGKNNILSLTPVPLKPAESSIHTLTTYPINSKIDKPGKWTFEVYLNNKLMFKKFLQVTALQ